jgi:putative ABC transport system permease protein
MPLSPPAQPSGVRGNRLARLHHWLIGLVSLLVPRSIRAGWRKEWQAELSFREASLAKWHRFNLKARLDLLRRSSGSFADALWLQPRRMEEDMFQDLKFGVRMLFKNPGFTFVAVAALAFGIGANTAIFSIVNAVVLRPLPYIEPSRLVFVWDRVATLGLNRNIVSPANYFDWEQHNRVFQSMAAYTEAFFNITGDDGDNPERIPAIIATPGFFQTLGVQPIQGRAFLAGDVGETDAARPVIISHGLWQRRFGGGPNIVGRDVTLNGARYTVVGILGAEFIFSGKKVDAFLPFAWNADEMNNRRGRYLTVIARLKPGTSREQAQSDMDSITGRLASDYPETNRDRGANVVLLEDEVFGNTRLALFVLLGSVGFVLAIACANVANLLLARASARRREIGIRLALGAGRLRIIRQLLTESLLLALLGGVSGLLLAWWSLDLLVALSPARIPRIGDVRLDGRVLGFTLLVSLLTGLIFGLVPALQASRTDLHESLKQGGKATSGWARNRARSVLVIAEVALSLVLLIGAGLMIKSFANLRRVDPGFAPGNNIAMDISLPNSYRPPQKRAAFFRETINRVEALPGVRSAGVTDNLPLSGEDATRTFTLVGASVPAGGKPAAEHRRISPHYFDAMGAMLLRGRAFTENDTDASADVVIVNEALARRFLSNEDALGKQLIIDDGPPRPREIVGIVQDVKHFSLAMESKPEMYVPQVDRPWPNMTLVVRAATDDPNSLVAAIRNEVAAIDKSIPIANIKTIDQYIAASLGQERFSTFLLGCFAVLASLLAAVGLLGVISYAVTQRTNEIGIRLALGARRGDVLRLVVGQGMVLALVGVGIGTVGALALTRVLANLLYGVSPTDPIIFAGVALLLVTVAFLACYIPARRATKIDPTVALRYE